VRSALLIVAVCLLATLMLSSMALADAYVSVWGDTGPKATVTSSWYGNTGLILTPSAETLPPQGSTIGWHRVNRDPDSLDAWTVNFGLIQDLEVGGARVDTSNTESEDIANLKYRIPVGQWLQNPEFPQVAIGVWDATDVINRSYYVVLSKVFDLGLPSGATITLHLGLANNQANKGTMDGVFGGLEFWAFRYGLIQAEYDGDAFNVALRYMMSNHLSVDLGRLDGDLGWGATYSSGF